MTSDLAVGTTILSQARAAVYEEPVAPAGVLAGDGAGVVASSGDPAWRPGDEVVMFPALCCWECEWCRAGQNIRCARFGILGEHSDGTAFFFISLRAPLPIL